MMTKWDEMPRIYDKSVEKFLWHDRGWLTQRAARYTPCCPTPLNIYELHPDTWMRDEHGSPLSYHRVADELAPYVKQMGYTHVLLDSPPAAQSDGDLRDLVDILHTAGVGVIVGVDAADGEAALAARMSHADGIWCRDSSDLLILSDRDAVAYPTNTDWTAHTLSCIECDLYDGSRRRAILVDALRNTVPNGILAISEREVCEGARSFLGKMPGDYWQKFAGVRLFASWMMTCPGVKQCFMGTEVGQFDEWSEARPVEWFLLDYDYHAKLQHYFAALNRLYLATPALWQSEAHILEDSADDGVLVFSRPSDKGDGDVVVILNLTPRAMEHRAICVPAPGAYREIFNSDASEFGGSHVVNAHKLYAEDADGTPTLSLRIPPLGVSVLRRAD